MVCRMERAYADVRRASPRTSNKSNGEDNRSAEAAQVQLDKQHNSQRPNLPNPLNQVTPTRQ